MGIRPVDLQPLVLKAPDIVRDIAGQQQQAAAAQQVLESESTQQHTQRAETVQAAEEVGAAAIHERGPNSGGQEEPDQDEQDQAEADGQPGAQPKNAAAPRVGRHIDIQA